MPTEDHIGITSEKIGFCRIRNIDEHSTGVYNLYLFDIKMLTKIDLVSIQVQHQF